MCCAVAAADSQSPRETKIKERKKERKTERKKERDIERKVNLVVTKFEARGGVTFYTIYDDLSAPAMKL